MDLAIRIVGRPIKMETRGRTETDAIQDITWKMENACRTSERKCNNQHLMDGGCKIPTDSIPHKICMIEPKVLSNCRQLYYYIGNLRQLCITRCLKRDRTLPGQPARRPSIHPRAPGVQAARAAFCSRMLLLPIYPVKSATIQINEIL